MKKLVIIPAFNEEGNLEKTIKDIKDNAPDFDYVIINDCSTDKTLEMCRRHGFSYLNLPVNLGIGGAVQTCNEMAYRVECGLQLYRFKNYATLYMIGRRRIC